MTVQEEDSEEQTLLSPSVLATTAAFRVWSNANTSQSESGSVETSLSDSLQSQNDSGQSEPTEPREAPPTSDSAKVSESKVYPGEIWDKGLQKSTLFFSMYRQIGGGISI